MPQGAKPFFKLPASYREGFCQGLQAVHFEASEYRRHGGFNQKPAGRGSMHRLCWIQPRSEPRLSAGVTKGKALSRRNNPDQVALYRC